MLFINEYRTFLASPIHFLLGLFMFIPPANMLTCTKTESNKLNQQFTLSEILQRMIYNLQYRPHEDPSWHLLPRNYNKNNVCGSGPQGPSPPPLSLSFTQKVTSLIVMTFWFLQMYSNKHLAASSTNCLPCRHQTTLWLCKHSCWDIQKSSSLVAINEAYYTAEGEDEAMLGLILGFTLWNV